MPPTDAGSRLLCCATVLISAGGLAVAQRVESCQFTTGGGTYDLCPLVGREFKLCKPGGFQDVEACYIASLMSNVESPCAGVAGPALETLSTGLGKGCRILGAMAERPAVAPLQSGADGVELKYTGGDVCAGLGQKWAASLQFVCNRSKAVTAARGASLMRVQPSPADKCTYEFVVASVHGCAVGLDLSPSAVLMDGERLLGHPSMILFSVLGTAAVYLWVGSYYKSSVLGHTSFPDFIPHIGFWKSYPGLVKDGLRWTAESIFAGGSRGPTSERAQLHADRQNIHRDTFSNLVPHRIGAPPNIDENLL